LKNGFRVVARNDRVAALLALFVTGLLETIDYQKASGEYIKYYQQRR
jgi:hypothetical protein